MVAEGKLPACLSSASSRRSSRRAQADAAERPSFARIVELLEPELAARLASCRRVPATAPATR